MLTKEQALFEFSSGRILPDKLTQKAHVHYLALATEMFRVYAEGVGKTRSELHHSIQELFWDEKSCHPRRIRAFCKLLDDVSEYEETRGGKIADLRIRVFSLAAERHPLVRQKRIIFAHDEATVKNEIATKLGLSWTAIENNLFSDVPELQRLKKSEEYPSEADFLARYNETQIQAALYSAVEMQVTARRDYRDIIMAAKRAMLMHDVERLPDNSFRFTFYGPVSPLRTTKRYGVHLARIIPRLLACRDWEMKAVIKFFKNGKQPELRLSSKDNYRSSVSASPEFDSEVEKNFAEKWGTAPRDGWILERESKPRFAGQKAFFPDFTFVHESGRRVLMEIVGHWTPEYLKAKRETLLQFREEPILLAVGAGEADYFLETGAEIILFKKALKIDPIKEALDRLLGQDA